MLSADFYIYLANLVYSDSQGGESLYISIGSGDPSWDAVPPTMERSTLTFVNEVARLAVSPADIIYLDANGNQSLTPTTRLRLHSNFIDEGTAGPVRETGVFGVGATSDLGTGQLLSYFTHPRVDKTLEMDFERIVTLDLSPSLYRLQGHLTRYLGNVSTEELHDLENETGGCQVAEIRSDRRHYFTTVQQALNLGYDHCAFCFGRELSQR